MAILLVHEMGHYLAARRRFLDVTLPYFLPGIFPAGTFGAFIKVRSPLPDKRALMEVGAAGPIAGSLLAIPLLAIGLYFSEFMPEKQPVVGFDFGSSLVLEFLCLIRFGKFSFDSTVLLHPTALAAWFGLFVTAMNLLPIGQLDGGHVVYALFGPRWAHFISLAVFACLIPLGIFVWPGWIVFGLLTFFLGLRHPPPLDPYTPLDRRRQIIGWTAIALFVLTFIPVPVTFVE
jgi:membrane-associated protease RseP (regulator of RpoE activity)